MNGSAPSLHGGPGSAALPDVLSELVERVTRGTWLWPSEKRDVQAELESHFREGLYELAEEGRSLDESVALLRDEFGDPKLAARLIRRGKKRGRPMHWKILVTSLVIGVVVLGMGAGYVTYVTFGKPTPTVDYIAKINEPVQAIPQENRAWPLLREIALEMQPHLEQLGKLTTVVTSPISVSTSLPKPGHANWTDVVDHVLTLRPLMPRLVEASCKPSYGFVYGQSDAPDYIRRRAAATKTELQAAESPDPLFPPTIAILLPNLSDHRAIGKFLVLNAREHMTRNEFTPAWQSLDAAYRLGLMLYSGQTLIEQLVGTAVVNLAGQEMRATLYAMRDRITPEDLAMVRAGSLFSAPADAIGIHFAGEQLMFNDCVQYTFTDDGNGDGRLIPSQFTKITALVEPTPTTNSAAGNNSDAHALAVAAMHADRRETVRKYEDLWDRSVELRALPLYDPRRAEADALIAALNNDAVQSRRFALITALMPSLSRADQLIREAAMSRVATQTVAALLAYRADHQTLPERLSAITPKYLPQLPTDAYSGMLLKYTRTPEGDVRLYSVGRNLQDDGGVPEKVTDPSLTDGSKMPLDIVYLPTN